jgi:hypothetical protein
VHAFNAGKRAAHAERRYFRESCCGTRPMQRIQGQAA